MKTSNQEQIEYWNGEAGHTWANAQDRLDALLAPISDAVVSLADPQAGERVIDIGCGCGATSLALAQSGAHVWGVDISEPMLARAQQRAEHLDNVRFSVSDASTEPYAAEHDLLFSRFGVMFFEDPYAAFAHLKTALADNGRLVFACWQAPGLNPWMALAGRAIQPFLPEAEPVDPKAPGPFAFADDSYLRDILQQAGYHEIAITPAQFELRLADDLDQAIAALSEVGPLARGLAQLDEATQAKAIHAAREAIAPYLSDNGLWLGSAVWLVRALGNPV